MLHISRQCDRELAQWPEEIRGDLADAVARLERGQILAMPLSRPMPSAGSAIHELRFRDRTGIYRLLYWLPGGGVVYLLHAFKKTSRKTPRRAVETARKRLRRMKP